jgi:cytochrome c553
MRRLIAAGWLLVGATGVFAGDAPVAAATCVACHGPQGVSANPEWPDLAGQHAGYLEAQVRAFRDGQRENPAMAPFVDKLTDRDMAQLAAYYTGLPRGTAANGDSSLVAKGENLSAYCKACHGMQGVPAAQVWPVIAGQQAAYLLKQLQAFKSGARMNPQMNTVVKPFGDDEFKALAAYYSQLKP